jgi:uncharacterized protein YbaA (DUF1428 family)
MTYVDGFIAPVRESRKQDYIDHATKMAPVFLEYGAIQIVETFGDDLHRGKVTDFYMAVKAEEGETMTFSWIVWPSKEVRDKGWAGLMADERMQNGGEPPFDGKRMIYSGFQTVLDVKA